MSRPDPDSSVKPGTKRRGAAVSISLIALTVIVATVIALSISRGGFFPAPESDLVHTVPSATTSTPIPAVTTAPGSLDEKTAESLLTSFLTAAATIPPDSTDVGAQIGDIAGNTIIEELEATLLELNANGWTRTGVPTVASSSIINHDNSGDTLLVTLEACIDSETVRTIDSAGDELATDPSAARALNLYTLGQQGDGSWILLTHSFPADPSC